MNREEMKREAILYDKLPDKFVQCNVCQQRCKIAPGKRGFCQTRQNEGGKLYTLIYGLMNAPIQIDPIEKKPLYHFHPNSLVASVGTYGCNFRCKQCLNWSSMWGPRPEDVGKTLDFGKLGGIEASPEELVSLVKSQGFKGIAFTYNEPTVWLEFVLDTSRLAKEEGLYTVFVTNGFITKEALDRIGPHMDAYAVDFKGFGDKVYKEQGNLEGMGKIPGVAKRAQEKWNMHVEITTLVIPGITDDLEMLDKMTEWIVRNLGPKTPLHLSSYSPELAWDEEFRKIPAPDASSLKEIAKVARENGLAFVYVWDVNPSLPGRFYQEGDTVCPNCENLAVERITHRAKVLNVTQAGKCKSCGEDLNIRLARHH